MDKNMNSNHSSSSKPRIQIGKITFSTYASLNVGLIFHKETHTYLLTYSKFDCGLEDKVSSLKNFSNCRAIMDFFPHFRVLGVILLHPTANASTMMESFKNSFSKWQMKHINASAENIVAFRKFGHKVSLSRFQHYFGVIQRSFSFLE